MKARLIAAAHAADLITFLAVASFVPIHGEWNPLARFMYESLGPPGIVAFKSISIGGVLLILNRLSNGLALTGTIVGTASGVLGAAVNTISGIISL